MKDRFEDEEIYINMLEDTHRSVIACQNIQKNQYIIKRYTKIKLHPN